MTTLITGGAGFIGSYVARLLVEAGERPVLFDIAPVHGPLTNSAAASCSSPVPRPSACADGLCREARHRPDLSSGRDAVLALGAQPLGRVRCERHRHLPCAGGGADQEAVQVIYGSTIATYSKDIPGDEIDDRTIQRPSSFYGVSKTFGELLGRFYHRKFGLDFRGVRLPSIVGPGARTAHMSIYNAWAIEYALKGLPYVLECEPETRCPCSTTRMPQGPSHARERGTGKNPDPDLQYRRDHPAVLGSELVKSSKRGSRAQLTFAAGPGGGRTPARAGISPDQR